MEKLKHPYHQYQEVYLNFQYDQGIAYNYQVFINSKLKHFKRTQNFLSNKKNIIIYIYLIYLQITFLLSILSTFIATVGLNYLSLPAK